MKRVAALGLFGCAVLGGVAGQESAPAAADPIDALVAVVRAAEAELRTLQLELETFQRLPDGLEVRTQGTLCVLRATQPGAAPQLASRLEYSFGDGLRGRLETVHTAAGILMFESDPAFGEVLVRIDPATVADLEWAGRVLQRDDLPGMADGRAQTPLGSGMLQDLRRSFALAIDPRLRRGADAGTWIVGRRHPGLGEHDSDLPLADRVELFVRQRDRALLEVRHFVGNDVVLEIVAHRLTVDAELPGKAFEIDAGGLRVRELQTYPPLWEQVEQALRQAEARAKDGEVRPSRR